MRHFILLFLCFISTVGYAQILKDTSTHTDIFSNTASHYFNKRTKSYDRIAFKFNPAILARGAFPIYAEKTLNNMFAVEAAIGLSFTDYYNVLVYGTNMDGSGTNSAPNTSGGILISRPFYNSNATVKTGVFLQLGARIYPDAEPMSGGFIQASIIYRENAINYPTFDSAGNNRTTTYAGKLKTTDLQILYGYDNDELFNSNNFLGEYYMGVGLKNFAGSYSVQVNNYNTGNSGNQIVNFNKSAPAFYIGFKIGFVIDMDKSKPKAAPGHKLPG